MIVSAPYHHRRTTDEDDDECKSGAKTMSFTFWLGARNAKPVNKVFVRGASSVMLRANCFNQTLASDATDTYINLTRLPKKPKREFRRDVTFIFAGRRDGRGPLSQPRRRRDQFYIISIAVFWDACKYLRCVLLYTSLLPGSGWRYDQVLMIDGWDGLIFKGSTGREEEGEEKENRDKRVVVAEGE